MFKSNEIEKIVDLLATLDTKTKIYFGCDSTRYVKGNGNNKVSMARYAAVVIIHKNGNNGCNIFSSLSNEIDYDVKKNKPKMRLMNETMKVCEIYLQLIPFIDEFDIEIHLDINSDPEQGSHCAAKEAAGMVLGMTGIEPKLKPDGFAASHGADNIVNHAKV